MKLGTTLIVVTTLMLLATLSACGGGGGSTTVPPPAPTPTKAVVTLLTSGTFTTAVSGIGAIDVTITLPASVTVKSSVTPTTDAGVVVPSGAAAGVSFATGVYTAATSSPATVRVLLTNTNVNGFSTGEFATVTCDLNGARPAAGDFKVVPGSLVSYGVSSVNTLDISNDLTVGMTMQLQ